MHHEAIAVIKRGNGLEGLIKEDGKVIVRWNVSLKKTTPAIEVMRAFELAEAKDLIVVHIYMDNDFIEKLGNITDSLAKYGADITPLSEDA